MGGAQSSGVFGGISSALTGNEFSQHAKAKEIREMSDALFKFMYSKWDIREIFEITEKPGDYVIAISDLITSQFHVLGYTTKRNKIGEIYFQKLEQLDPPQSAEDLSRLRSSSGNVTRSQRVMKKEAALRKKGLDASRGEPGAKLHHQHAKIISFYFVVIFQILGSLLLVLKDTGLEMIDNQGRTISDTLKNSDREFTGQGVTLPLFKAPRPQGGGGLRVYSRNEPLGAFEFLRFYLRRYDEEEVERYLKEYKLTLPPANTGYYKFMNNDSLLFKFIKQETDRISSKETAELNIFVRNEKSDVYEIKRVVIKVEQLLGGLGEYKPPSAYTNKQEQYSLFPMQVTLETRDKKRGSSTTSLVSAVFQKDESDRHENYLDGLKYKIANNSSTLYGIISTSSGSSDKILPTEMEKILEKFALLAVNTDSSIVYYPFKIKESDERERNSRGYGESRVEGPKNNDRLAETFRILNNVNPSNGSVGYKHVPHCIKRAKDLLDLPSINDFNGLAPANTRICSSDIGGRGSSYVPLKSIAQLYGKLNAGAIINVDEIEFNKAIKVLEAFVGKSAKGYMTVSELKESGQESEANDLSLALKRLSASFSQIKDDDKLNKIDDLVLYKPRSCVGKEKGELTVNKSKPVFKNMQGYSRQLLGFHLNNVINISKFLMTIFNVSQRPDGSWHVEGPKTEILFAGFSVLDVLKDQARELLLAYYVGCEDIYQKGVKEWADSETAAGPAGGPGGPGGPGAAAENNPGNPSAPKVISRAANPGPPQGGGRRLI